MKSYEFIVKVINYPDVVFARVQLKADDDLDACKRLGFVLGGNTSFNIVQMTIID